MDFNQIGKLRWAGWTESEVGFAILRSWKIKETRPEIKRYLDKKFLCVVSTNATGATTITWMAPNFKILLLHNRWSFTYNDKSNFRQTSTCPGILPQGMIKMFIDQLERNPKKLEKPADVIFLENKLDMTATLSYLFFGTWHLRRNKTMYGTAFRLTCNTFVPYKIDVSSSTPLQKQFYVGPELDSEEYKAHLAAKEVTFNVTYNRGDCTITQTKDQIIDYFQEHYL